jgi:hypothetical protein
MIPSGYKEDTVFSAIPTDGSGDLSFTRASNGTRVNSAGLVEVCPWNLVEQSETFGVLPWNSNAGGSVDNNATTAPNGTTTADRLNCTSSGASGLYQIFNTISGQSYTSSIYIKNDSNSTDILLGTDAFPSTANLRYNPSTNTIISVGSAITSSSVENVGNGWYRVVFSYVVTGSFNAFVIYSVSATTNSLFVWGAQSNFGSTAKPYFPTTDRLNVPRLTYQNGGGGCPSLLLEKQSTNLALYSEQFDNAAWTKGNSTITANTAISPDGTQNADAIVDTATNAEHNINQTIGITSNVSSTFSVYLKSGTQQFAMLRHFGAASEQYFCVVVNLNTGTITKTQAGTDTSATSSSITNVGNGWYRVTATCTYASTNAIPILQLVNSATPTIGSFGNNSYTGNGTNSVLVWGFQFEQSSYPTSYIPTTSASATRIADACFKTGISSLIGQTEGTIFLDFVWGSPIGDVIPLDITGSDGKLIWFRGIGVQFYGNGTTLLAQLGSATPVQGTRYKSAFVYGANDFKLYRNGVLVGTDTSGTFTGSFSDLALNSVINHTNLFNQVVLFKTKLTDSELIALTS